MKTLFDQSTQQLRLFLFLLLQILHLQQGNVIVKSQTTSLHCDATTCLECLDMGCGWIPTNLCMRSCSYIAHADCYNQENYPNAESNEEICNIVTTHKQDQEYCLQAGTDCTTCVNTIKSDGESCLWDKFFNACGRGICNQLGCPTTTCDDNDDAGGVTLPSSCSSARNCEYCLKQECAWSDGECIDSCDMIADDITCITLNDNNNIFQGQTEVEICEIEKKRKADEQICQNKTDCMTCIKTVKSDGFNLCEWYENSNTCGIGGCDMNDGCGISVCPDTTPCNTASNCTDCLLLGYCGWNANRCVESCTDIADSTCYSIQTFPGKTDIEICELYTQTIEDEIRCNALTDCSTCVTTLMLDGVSTCIWYNNTNTCGTKLLCDLNNGCDGSTTCELQLQAPNNNNCDSYQSCMECLNNNCAWSANGSCSSICNTLSNIPCYSEFLYPNYETKEQICEKEQNDTKNTNLCSLATDCISCIGTIVTDASKSCLWFSSNDNIPDNKGNCCFPGPDCVQIGPGNDITCESTPDVVTVCMDQTDCKACQATVLSDGTTTCQWYQADDNTSTGICCDGSADCGDNISPLVSTCSRMCNSVTNCDDCLNLNCAWSVGNCLESCDIIADAACYSRELFADMESSEICAKERTANVDASLCSDKVDCAACTETVMSDGINNCHWYLTTEGVSSDYCGSGEIGMNGISGMTSCEENITTNDEQNEKSTLDLRAGSASHFFPISVLPSFLLPLLLCWVI